MIQKKSVINFCAFLIFMLIVTFLVYCSTCMGQTLNPFLSQSILPWGIQTPLTPINALGTGFSFNAFNNLSGFITPYGANPFWGASPLINTGLSLNPYIAAAQYYAAALLPADVVGAWSGTWTTTSALISLSGDISLTLVQATNDVAGTLLFLAGSTVKLGSPVVGVIDVDLLTITGSGVLAGKSPIPYEIVMSATVLGAVMEGDYVIKETLLGSVIEEGTFSLAKL